MKLLLFQGFGKRRCWWWFSFYSSWRFSGNEGIVKTVAEYFSFCRNGN